MTALPASGLFIHEGGIKAVTRSFQPVAAGLVSLINLSWQNHS
jgi:hypothetical protein